MRDKTFYMIVVVCIVTMIMSGCATVSIPSSGGSSELGIARSMDFKDSGVLQKPLVSDLKIGQGIVNGTANGDLSEKSVKQLETEAIWDACKKANCDILFEPKFEYRQTEEIVIKTTPGGQRKKEKITKMTINVSGLPANYERIRDIQDSDYKWIEIFHKQSVSQKSESDASKAMFVKDISVLQKPLVTDLKIGQEKVNGTANGTFPEKSINQLEKEAIWDACKKANCEILFNPKFEYILTEETERRVQGNGKLRVVKTTKVTINVSGFPANYDRIRDIQDSDYKWIEIFHKK